MNNYLMRIQSYFGAWEQFIIKAENKQDALIKAKTHCKNHHIYGHGGNYKFDSIECIKKMKK